jgi:hypothetical protein
MFKKTEHTDLCIRTTDGGELWHSTYMLGVHSQMVLRNVVAHTLRVDETRPVVENLLNLVEGRVAPLSAVSYRTYKLANQLGFYNTAGLLREKLLSDPSLEFLKAERGAPDYPKALHAFLLGASDGPEIVGDIAREFRELYEATKVARKHFKDNAPASGLRTLDAYFSKHRTK